MTKFVVVGTAVAVVAAVAVPAVGFEEFAAKQGFVAAVELEPDFAAKLLSEIELVFSLEIG